LCPYPTLFRSAFLPQEITGYHMIESGKLNVKRAFKALHNHLPTTFSKFAILIDNRTTVEAYRFKTKAYFMDENNFDELYRGHKIYDTTTKDDVANEIKLTTDNYDKNDVKKGRTFIYSSLAHVNRQEKRYSISRHAGTIYSMLEVYEIMPDDELMPEIKRAFKFP